MNITNELVTEYIHDYYEALTPDLERLRTFGEENMIPIILKESEMLLTTILKLKQPKKILEIGTAIGYSSLYFATLCKNVEIFTIEKDQTTYIQAIENISKTTFEKKIHVYNGDGEEVIRNTEAIRKNKFDMVFIDAAKSHYKRFLDSVLPLCDNNALIISDNILQRGMTVSDRYDAKDKHRTNIKKMREYVEYITTDSRFTTSLLSVGDGMAITIYRGENEKI